MTESESDALVLAIAQQMNAAVINALSWDQAPLESRKIYLRDARIALRTITLGGYAIVRPDSAK